MFDQLAPTDYIIIFFVILLIALIFIVLLPPLFELRRPKDAGPRKILKNLVYFLRVWMAPSEGLEPSTYELTARCSTELSYDGSTKQSHDVAILRICGAI